MISKSVGSLECQKGNEGVSKRESEREIGREIGRER
jgi:hypothetical protein